MLNYQRVIVLDPKKNVEVEDDAPCEGTLAEPAFQGLGRSCFGRLQRFKMERASKVGWLLKVHWGTF